MACILNSISIIINKYTNNVNAYLHNNTDDQIIRYLNINDMFILTSCNHKFHKIRTYILLPHLLYKWLYSSVISRVNYKWDIGLLKQTIHNDILFNGGYTCTINDLIKSLITCCFKFYNIKQICKNKYIYIKKPLMSEYAGILIIYNGHTEKYIELKNDNCVKQRRRIIKRL